MTRRLRLPQDGASARDIAVLVNQLLIGRINAFGEVTLNAGSTSTTIERPYVGTESAVLLMPKTANAATALSTTYITCRRGAFDINHVSNAQTDRTFNFAVLGG